MNDGPYPYWKTEPPPHIGAQVDQIAAHTAETAAALLDSYMKFSIAVDQDDPAKAHGQYLAFVSVIHKLMATPEYDWVPIIGQLCDSVSMLALRHHGGWEGVIKAAMRGDLIFEAGGDERGSAAQEGE